MEIDWTVEVARIVIYILAPMVVLTGWGMWTWERMARKKNKVVYVREDGDTDVEYVDKEGGQVRIKNPVTDVDNLWPVSQLSTIGQPYPDLGILPRFLTREIRTVIVMEGDIEPLLNRSPHRNNVLSPNVVDDLRDVIEDETCSEDVRAALEEILNNAVTGPTRELVARPNWVGSLEKSSALKALASVGDDLLEKLEQIRNQLTRLGNLNAMYVYMGLGVTILLQGFVIYQMMQGTPEVDINVGMQLKSIQDALGIIP